MTLDRHRPRTAMPARKVKLGKNELRVALRKSPVGILPVKEGLLKLHGVTVFHAGKGVDADTIGIDYTVRGLRLLVSPIVIIINERPNMTLRHLVPVEPMMFYLTVGHNFHYTT